MGTLPKTFPNKKMKSERGLSMKLSEILRAKCNKDISSCSNEEIYFALLEMVQELGEEKINKNQDK